MKRLRAGGIYQDAAEGRRAGSCMREDSQPTRRRWAAANALLISATEKIPPHPQPTSSHSHLSAVLDSDLAPVFGVEGQDQDQIYFWGGLNLCCKEQ